MTPQEIAAKILHHLERAEFMLSHAHQSSGGTELRRLYLQQAQGHMQMVRLLADLRIHGPSL